MKRSFIYDLICFIPMAVFVFLGLCGSSTLGCSWVNGYFWGASLSILILAFFVFRKVKLGVFLLASVLYLSIGAIFILVDYKTGYDFLFKMMATGFFLVYFLVLLFQIIFCRFCAQFMEPKPKFPVFTLALYLAVVVLVYFLKEKSLWISILIFMAATFLFNYIEKNKSY